MKTANLAETFTQVETPSIPDDVRSDLQCALSCLADAQWDLDCGLNGLLVETDKARADTLGELIANIEFVIAKLEDIL